MELCDLPRDIIQLIIEYCPYGQWFRLSKELNTLASQVISPLHYRTEDNGALCWAIIMDNPLAVISLLKDPRIFPHFEAMRYACEFGHKEIIEILLKDDRVDPSKYCNSAIREACYSGHKEIVEMLLKDSRVDPTDNDNEAIQHASMNGHKEIVEMLLKDSRVAASVDKKRYYMY
jgi:ankyrin repeat protein